MEKSASKVVFGGETVVDLTQDTVTPETLAEGITAHNAAGEAIVGEMVGFLISSQSEPDKTSINLQLDFVNSSTSHTGIIAFKFWDLYERFKSQYEYVTITNNTEQISFPSPTSNAGVINLFGNSLTLPLSYGGDSRTVKINSPDSGSADMIFQMTVSRNSNKQYRFNVTFHN